MEYLQYMTTKCYILYTHKLQYQNSKFGKKLFLKIKAENFGKLFDCLVEILKKILCVSK